MKILPDDRSKCEARAHADLARGEKTISGPLLEEIRQDLSSLCQIVPGHEKPNRDVPSQVKILALGQIRYSFRFKNRFYE
jgi:hypothetical protein